MSKTYEKRWLVLGPLFVIIGAGLWGTETFFRVYLNTQFDSEILVFHEHLFCILFTLPVALIYFFSQSRPIAGAPPHTLQLSKVSRPAWIYLILSGTIGSALGTTFFTMALNVMNPSVANVLLNFQPLVSVYFANLLLGEKLGQGFYKWGIIALLMGLIIAGNGFDFKNLNLSLGIFYIFITALAWGFSTVAGRRAVTEIPLPIATFGRFVIGAVTLFISLLVKGKFISDLLKWNLLGNAEVLKNFLLLSFAAGVVPLYFYFKGLSRTSASVGGFCELTQTFTALLLTWGVMGQALTLVQVVAGVILLFAVYMVNLNFHRINGVDI